MYKGERFNTITHLIGVVLSVVAFSVLVTLASLQGNPWKIVSFCIYGTTLFLLYLASTLYHSLRGKTKELFRILDHIAIYILIAGTYTPFTLVTLRNSSAWGWSLFGVIWALATVGMIIEIIQVGGRLRILSLFIYVGMGWLILIAIYPLAKALPQQGIAWLVGGGVAYTGGIFFFAMDEKLRHAHGIWHIFVLVGSLCHFLAILLYVL